MDEAQSELRGANRYAVYSRMRNDAQVAALLNVIELPIRAADYTLEPREPSSVAQEIRDFVAEELFQGNQTFDDFVRQALLMIPYGVMLFEKVFRLRPDGRIGWERFAPRLPATIVRWDVSPQGEFLGVEQQVWGRDRRPVYLPAWKLLRFTYREEAGNFAGRPLLRDVYKHWWYKDTLYRLAALAAERTGVGIPVIQVPRNAPPMEQERAAAIVRALRANEEAGVVLPSDFELTLTTGRGFSYLPLIEHHDRMIAKAALAQFLNLGQTQVGSFALSRSQTDLFLMTLNGILQHLCGVIEREGIGQLVWWNYGEGAPVPRLRGKLRTTDAGQFAETLDRLVHGGLLTPDGELERVVRESLDLPAQQQPVG
ncbi:MAG: hypothetical protein KatS3mg115_1373 [Candidatus Poribacteria bacterium]|nr:MAG: hypothetical protein KatS3mg115_1373 [Candidatus Poribacteria bacterium]